MEKLLNQLVERLKSAHAERLVSVVLYGSAVTGEHNPKFSDVNVLCVLTEVTTREMGASEEIFRWWREKGSPSPLLLSEAELTTSTDCFAIEFHDIQRHHRLLYGKDLVTALRVDDSSYRTEVEHDLRAKLLRLRQKASGMFSDSDSLRRLLLDSVSTFCVLFRHALILHGEPPALTKRQVVAAARERFGIDPLPFDKLLDVREGLLKPRDVEPTALMGSYLRGIAVVIDAVDHLEK